MTINLPAIDTSVLGQGNLTSRLWTHPTVSVLAIDALWGHKTRSASRGPNNVAGQGFMTAFDYDLNIVTATIAAISVGVGIDFSIHYTMRYREQLRAAASRIEAIRLAAEGTGTALVLSGTTSVVGFGLLALAPMPIMASYGLLTAVMIAFSLLAALIVLPSLLFIVSSEPAGGEVTAAAPEPFPGAASN